MNEIHFYCNDCNKKPLEKQIVYKTITMSVGIRLEVICCPNCGNVLQVINNENFTMLRKEIISKK